MKFLTLATACVFAFAAHAGGDKKFSVQKEEATKNIDKQISALQSYKSCVSGASDQQALSSCRYEGPSIEAQAQEEPLEMDKQKMEEKVEDSTQLEDTSY